MFEYNRYQLNNLEIVKQCEKLSFDNNIVNGGVLNFADVVKPSDVLFCATSKQGNVVGFVCLKYYKCFKNAIYIEQIVVNKNYTRMGVGTKLVTMAVEYAKDHKLKYLFANCRKNNIASQKLFAKCGFKKYKMSESVYAELEFDKDLMNNSYALKLAI